MSRPRVPLAPETLARLRVAAAEEFGSLGFDRASLNRVVESAGLAKSSLYHHVGGKQALFDDLVAFLHEIVDDLTLPDPASLTADGYWDAAQHAAADLERIGVERPETRAVASALSGPHSAAALRTLRDRVSVYARDFLTRGQELGVVRRDIPADLLADMAVAALLAIDAWALARTDAGDDSRSALRMLRRMMEGD